MKLNSTHLKRYKEIARLFWKYGRSDLAKELGAEEDDSSREGPDTGVDGQNYRRPVVADGKTIETTTAKKASTLSTGCNTSL